MYKATLYSILFLCLVIASLGDSLAETVLMVPCINDTACIYQGNFHPNGTLNPGEWAYYSVDLTVLDYPSSAGLSVADSYLSPDSSIQWYLNGDSFPSADTFVATANLTCAENAVCPPWLPPSAGVCNSAHTNWYIGVQNIGKTPASYAIVIEIDDGAGNLFGCQWLWGWFGGFLIAVYILAPLTCLVCCVVCICCACRARRCRQGYTPIDSSCCNTTRTVTSTSINTNGMPPLYSTVVTPQPPATQPPPGSYPQPPLGTYPQPPSYSPSSAPYYPSYTVPSYVQYPPSYQRQP